MLQAREIFDRLAQAASGTSAVIAFEDDAALEGTAGTRQAAIRVGAAPRLPVVMGALRDDPALRFDFLQNLTAVDWIKRDAIEVVYHLFSYEHRHSICVKVDLPRAAPRLPSVTALWPTANWHEREQYDLLGVVFEGHPDLRRLLMPDDWVGHPMRKDFHEPKSYRGMPTSRPSPLDLLRTYDRAHTTATVSASPPASVSPPAPTPKTGGES